MSAKCSACNDSGERNGNGYLDCSCAAATDRAALEAHLQAHQREFGRLHERDMVWEACKFGMAKREAVSGAPIPPFAGPASQHELTRLDVLSLIRQHTHRCYVAGVDMLEIDPMYMQEIEDGLRSLFAWKPLNDVQWMNIVNHGFAYANFDKDEAVHEAVKRTEAKLKEINGGNFAAPTNNSTESTNDR